LKKSWLILVLLLVVLGIAYFWYRDQGIAAPESVQQLPLDLSSGSAVPADEGPPGKMQTEEESIRPGSESLKAATATEKEPTGEDPSAEPESNPQDTRAIDEVLQDEYRYTTESVLHGDPDSAIELGRLLDYCRSGFRSADQIQRSLESIAGQGEWKGARNMVIRGESLNFKTFGEYESYLWKRHDQCTALQSVTGRKLQGDIQNAADAGDPVARYVYAMWPPEESFGTTAATLEYHERALEYTWRNIEEGQPLGLLALGQSYMNRGTSPLFTPWNHTLGRIFILAAAKCGLSNAWLDEEIDLMLDGLSSPHPSAQQVLGQLNSQSDELRKLYCG
jgi:hypothetical protein